MKNLLLKIAFFASLMIVLTIIQFSCQTDVLAQPSNSYVLPPATTSALGGVIVDGTTINVDGAGKISVAPNSNTNKQYNKIVYLVGYEGSYANEFAEIWIANYDGTGKSKLNVSIQGDPSSIKITDPRISPDGSMIFFTANAWIPGSSTYNWSIYSCNLDGSNIKKVIDGGAQSHFSLGGVY
jgi:hypothetical protein